MTERRTWDQPDRPCEIILLPAETIAELASARELAWTDPATRLTAEAIKEIERAVARAAVLLGGVQ